LLERAVGGGDRGRTDLELDRQVANRGQTLSRRESVFDDRRFDPRGDRRGARTLFDTLF
jgi:hypothetical protein